MFQTIFRNIIIAFVLSFSLQSSYAQYSDSISISLITCRPGDEVYSYWGHTSIRVKDHKLNKDHFYNYGMFSYEEPGFVMKFLRGKLLYWLGVQRSKSFLNAYDFEKRSLLEQELNLNKEQEQALLSALKENMKEENRKYLYDFFFDNCTTRPRDIILETLGLADDFKKESPNTFRQLINQYSYMYPWTDFGTDLIIGAGADRKATYYEQMFLPEYLYVNFENLRTNNPEILLKSQLILDHESENIKRQKPRIFSPTLVFGILCLIELLLLLGLLKTNKFVQFYDKTFFIVMGIGGLILLFMWFGTDHIATKNNLNVLWMSPLYFLVTKGNKTLLKILLFLLVVSIPIGLTIQQFHLASIMIIMLMVFKILRWLQFKEQ